MKIAVCIKQVPATQDAKMDPDKGVLLRDSAAARLNPYDVFAIEAALRLKEGTGGSVTALTMGPETALKVLQEACAMGADEGCLLSGRAFAGADVLATSYALSQALRALGGFDLILCGRQTTDGDTAQVGPAIAAHLGLPCLCWVKGIKAVSESSVTVRQSVTGGEQVVTCPLPCVLAADKDIFTPRAPTLKRKLQASKLEYRRLALSDLPDADPNHYGLPGSATSVERIFPPEWQSRGAVHRGSPEELAALLAEALIPFLEEVQK